VSGVTGSYQLSFLPTNGTVVSTSISEYTVTGNIKWTAGTGTDGYKGQVKADLLVGTTHYYSVPISVTIKSIKDQVATFTGIPSGSPWNLSACESGTLNLEAGNMFVPGTGDLFPEQVNSFAWLVPKGWTVNGWTSPDGTTWKITSQNVTVTYPKSDIGGSIKVKASYLIACGDYQESKESNAITVNRSVTFTLTPNVSNILCGTISPITYTVTPALSCALYYWNNSQTPTTSNSFQLTPDGHSPVIATVTVVYGTSTQTKSNTMNYLLFAPGVVPIITGSATICTGNYSYDVTNLRPGYTVNWTISSNLHQVSIVGNTLTINSSSIGSGTISATITTDCGAYPSTISHAVWIGGPELGPIVGPDELPNGCIVSYSIAAQGNPTTYQWSIPNKILCPPNLQWQILYGGNQSSATYFAGCQSGYIHVTVGNDCGTAPPVGKYIDIDDSYDCNGMKMLSDSTINETDIDVKDELLIYPNSASDFVQVSIVHNSTSTQDALLSDANSNQDISDSYSVRVYNIYGILVYSLNKTSCPFTIPVSSFINGTYIINVSDNTNSFRQQFVVKH
jgi:hypothetical protein